MMGLLSKGLRQVAWMMATVIFLGAYAWLYLFLFVFFPIWWPIDRYWARKERERSKRSRSKMSIIPAKFGSWTQPCTQQ